MRTRVWVISWLCWVSSIDLNELCVLGDVGPISLAYTHACMTWHYFIGLSKIKTVDSAQPRNRSDRFPHERWGLGTSLSFYQREVRDRLWPPTHPPSSATCLPRELRYCTGQINPILSSTTLPLASATLFSCFIATLLMKQIVFYTEILI